MHSSVPDKRDQIWSSIDKQNINIIFFFKKTGFKSDSIKSFYFKLYNYLQQVVFATTPSK